MEDWVGQVNPAMGGPGASARASNFDIYRQGQTTPAIRLSINMVLTARRWRALLDERLRPLEQSSARMETLAAILNSPEGSAQVDIAKRLRIEGPTLTRMIDTLEKDRLVERMPDPNDRRTKKLRVTEAGEALLEKMFLIADSCRESLFDGVEPETVADLNEFYSSLLARLDAGLPGSTDRA